MKNHLTSIFTKLGVQDRQEAIRYFLSTRKSADLNGAGNAQMEAGSEDTAAAGEPANAKPRPSHY